MVVLTAPTSLCRIPGVLLATMLAGCLGAASASEAAVTVRVDITNQTMSVNATSGEAYDWKISTGRLGYRTPNGVYRPQRLERFWRSRRYGMAPMPHSIFFRGGYAIHGTTETNRLGRPASHGCIRLHPAHAATLFSLVQRHSRADTRIIITGAARDRDEPSVARVRDDPPVRRVRRAPRSRYYYDDPYDPYEYGYRGGRYYYYDPYYR
jgi:hypothetical protein